ncbi:MAG TPA: flagellar biosynthetic protein FliO [Burkholderiaceae bacterium]|nr:flagellar biosynthetic protein FliO [Burkholderiaceae bacterium]
MDLKSPASGPAAALSASQAASSAEPGLPLIRASEAEAPYGSLLSTVITVALVGAAVIWALRRSGLGRLRAAPANARMLQVRETVHVAPKVRVTYLRCGEHELLLAHSEHSQAWITLPPAGPAAPPATPTPTPQDPANAA